MEWSRTGQYHLDSDCRKYRICKVIIHDGPSYELWNARENKMLARGKTSASLMKYAEKLDAPRA